METPAKPSRFSRDPSPRTVTLMLLVSGLVVLAIAVPLLVEGWSWRGRTQPIDGGTTTTGRVVEILEDGGARGGSTYEAVVEYTDASAARYTVTTKAGEEKPVVGAEVQVSYDPDDPARAHDLTTGQGVWQWPFWTGALVAFMALFPLVAAVFRLLARKPPQA